MKMIGDLLLSYSMIFFNKYTYFKTLTKTKFNQKKCTNLMQEAVLKNLGLPKNRIVIYLKCFNYEGRTKVRFV